MMLPPEIAEATAPLFEKCPLDAAMPDLIGERGASRELRGCVEAALANPVIGDHPALCAGLWLYVDELDRSHGFSQSLPSSTGSYWHGIMHRREGDFGNSHYWFRNTGPHPVIATLQGYDPHEFVDAVAADGGRNSPELVALQREEWAALFAWCAENTGS